MKITKQITNKLTVCVIIWLLVSVSIATFVMPAGADETNWQDISSLPVTITESGNYRITTDLTADTENAISIQANDVVLDGQNHTINADIDHKGILAVDVTNITILNLNIISGADGIYLSNVNSSAIHNYNANQAFSDGISICDSANFTISNYTIVDSGDCGINIWDSTNFQITSSNIAQAQDYGISIDTSTNFEITSCYVSNSTEYDGMQFYGCSEFNVTDSTIQDITSTRSDGISVEGCINFNIIGTTIDNCNQYGINLDTSKEGYTYNGTISSCIFTNNNDSAVYAYECENITISDCIIANQSGIAIMGVQVNNLQVIDNAMENLDFGGVGVVCTNGTITNNTFKNIGFSINPGITHAAIGFSSSNMTITNNVFNQNFDAIYWNVYSDGIAVNESICNADIQKNVFLNNSNTFRFGYEFPTSYDYQKFIFSNNLVNDTAYIDPASLQMAGTNTPINGAVFNFNSTISLGQRTQITGPFVGGNYWAHPDGTGPSQTGTDADRDGFIDTPFELFGNVTVGTAYDYHPYSDNFDTEQWINITLPAEIYSPGHYRIMSSWSGEGIGLFISANNVTVDGQNCVINGSTGNSLPLGVYVEQGDYIDIENLTIQNAFAGTYIKATHFTLANINTDLTTVGVYVYRSSNFAATNINSSNALSGILIAYSENFTVTNCRVLNTTLEGFSVFDCEHFAVENIVCNGSLERSGAYFQVCNDFQINACNLTCNAIDGFTITYSDEFILSNSTLNGNGWGSEIFECNNATIQSCQISNNSQAVYTTNSDNLTFTNNIFSYNGKDHGAYTGGLEASDSNVTVTNNLFESNYDAYIWNANHENITSNQRVYNNIFRNNNYTFFFVSQLPSNCTTQKLYFYNNLVNDLAYVDTNCFNATYSGNYLPFNSTIFNFNIAQQAGTRIYSSGPNIGGNFWAHPDGTGPSQTGTDANKDGFIDTAFELFGNATIGTAYDYLPLSTSYTAPASGSTSTTTTTTTTKPTVTPTPTPTPTPNTIQATKDDNTQTTLTINGNITASQFTNAVISTNTTAATTTLSFTITGEHGTVGFSNITIAKSSIQVGAAPVVYIDGVRAENQGYTEDANNYYVWFTTGFSTHQVSVQFSGATPAPAPVETPSWVYAAVIVAIIAVLAVAIVALKRKH